MSSATRQVILQNNDSSIQYFGNQWTTVPAEGFDSWGNFGPPFSPILHSIATTGSLSLRFNGSAINVVGSANVANISAQLTPSWQCSVDGISLQVPSGSATAVKFNMLSLCATDDPMADGQHELTIDVMSNGQPFYLDYIEYTASSDVSLENSFISIQNTDPAIDYISGWTILGDIANQTVDPNGLANVTFVGTQLYWYGFVPDNADEPNTGNSSSAEYSIDGGPSKSFPLQGLPESATFPSYNKLFFTTPSLEMGTHVLSVKYTGLGVSARQTPLTLDWLVVANGSFPSASEPPTNSSGSSGSTNGTTTHSSNPSPSNNTGSSISDRRASNHAGIIGGVVGSVVGVALIVLFVWFKFYRKRSERNSLNEITPFLHQPATDVSPPQTSEVSKRHTQDELQPNMLWVDHTNPNYELTHPPASRFATSSSLPGSSAPVTASQPRLQPESSAIAHQTSSNMIHTHSVLVRHEDSGIRLPPGVITEEIAIPPTYTER